MSTPYLSGTLTEPLGEVEQLTWRLSSLVVNRRDTTVMFTQLKYYMTVLLYKMD